MRTTDTTIPYPSIGEKGGRVVHCLACGTTGGPQFMMALCGKYLAIEDFWADPGLFSGVEFPCSKCKEHPDLPLLMLRDLP